MKRKFFAYPYILWMIVLIVAPMLLILFYAFTGQIDGHTIFTLDNIKRAFDPLFLGILWDSIVLAIIATVVCLLLGYPISYLLSRMSKRKASIISIFFILPMWMNFLLRTYAWMALLDTNGLINTIIKALGFEKMQLLYNSSAVVMGMIYNYLPFMILPIYNTLQKIPTSSIEAAQDLGADQVTVFKKVVFPLSMPGVISGIMMVFIPSITTFAISRLLGGSQYMLYGDLIENQFIAMNDKNFGSALSVIMLVLVVISMIISNKYDKSGEGGGLM